MKMRAPWASRPDQNLGLVGHSHNPTAVARMLLPLGDTGRALGASGSWACSPKPLYRVRPRDPGSLFGAGLWVGCWVAGADGEKRGSAAYAVPVDSARWEWEKERGAACAVPAVSARWEWEKERGAACAARAVSARWGWWEKTVVALVLVAGLLVQGGEAAERPTETKMANPYVSPLAKDTAYKEGIIGPDSAMIKDSLLKAKPAPVLKAAPAPVQVVKVAEPTMGISVGLLPVVVHGKGIDDAERSAVEAALRLGASESGKYWVWNVEEGERRIVHDKRSANECFSERCIAELAHQLEDGLAMGVQYSRLDTMIELKMVLLEATTGSIRLALHAEGHPSPDSLIPFVRDAAARLVSHQEGTGVTFVSGHWDDIGWLNPRDSVDNRRSTSWAGAGLLVAATGLAWAEGQLLNRDDNRTSPQGAILDDDGARSFLRGFFTAPTLGARYAAMGGAGIAHVNNGLALLMNPAGVSETEGNNAIAAKRELPGGTPSLFVGYAGPLYEKWSHGLGVQYEGDALASETTVEGALGYDMAAFGKTWEGFKAGAEVKIYLAEVGRSGTGEERATGHSVGAGLDIGLRARINEKISAALVVRDLISFLHHTNTLTDQGHSEVLPPEYRIGAAYQVSSTSLFLMDGQKGIYADQADHVRLGAEQVVFRFLALRCGMHEIFGREAVRKVTLGFGLNTDGIKGVALSTHVALNYGYEFGLNEYEPLGGGQQFSLEMGF